jgi:acetylornithine aminotransferase
MSHLLWYPGHDLTLENIVSAKNCHLLDADGKSYLDLESGVWSTSIGHAHPKILRVLTDQAARIAHTGFCYSSTTVEDSALEILSLLEFDQGKCVFLCSGSEAVEYCIRATRQVEQRPLLMTMTDSYCGSYGSAWEKREDEWFCFDWARCEACPRATECNDSCEHWSAIPFSKIGGFLFEPGSSSGFVRFPPRKLVRNIVAKIRSGNGLIIANEVTTGLGRTGKWFGYQHYELCPDIVAIGKGIGNGYPVSVAAFSSTVASRLEKDPLPYAQSHQNDPLGATIAREVMQTIRDEELIKRAENIAAMLSDGLQGIKIRTNKITEVRARGLMAAIELADDSKGSYTSHVRNELLARGYVVAQRPSLILATFESVLTK